MKKIEHIGIAVKSLSRSNELFAKLFDSKPYKTEVVEEQGVATSFFRVGPNKIELLEALTEESPISKYLDKFGEGIHHIAFDVDDINSEIERLESEGFQLIGNGPSPGADNKMICFLHPKSCNGILVELCQEIQK